MPVLVQVLFFLLTLGALFLLGRSLLNRITRANETLQQTLQQEIAREVQGRLPDLLGLAMQKPLLDLTERLGRHFLDSQERVDRTLGQNRQELQLGLQKTTAALEVKFQSLDQQMTKLESIGKNVETKLNENLKEGFKHFEKVQQHLAAAELKLASLNAVGQSISELNQLLKLPHLRGSFGEATLERLLADFLPAQLV